MSVVQNTSFHSIFRNSAITGFVSALAFGLLNLGFNFPGTPDLSCATRMIVSFLVVLTSMIFIEVFYRRTFRSYFSFARARSIDLKSLNRIIKRCFAVLLLLLLSVLPVFVIDAFYVPVALPYLFSLPFLLLLSLLYFFLFELFGLEIERGDEWLRLSDFVVSLFKCLFANMPWRNLSVQFSELSLRQTFLSFILRVYFGILLILYFAQNFQWLEKQVHKMYYLQNILTQDNCLNILPIIFVLILRFICTFDSALGAVGYLTACRLFGTELRSVDRTWTGWAVTLLCYHPFCQFEKFATPVFSYSWPDTWFRSSPVLWISASALILIFVLVYAWSNICFGMAFSNLTNRGIIKCGPYGWVRHPAYASKLITWWICTIPLCLETDLAGALVIASGMIFVTLIFCLRAVTEENHLSQDPLYREYCRLVPWRFIPYVC